jgi:hypothetical protein
MRLPRSLPALEALQWFGLAAAPLAFAAQHVLGVGATLARCNPASLGLDPHVYQLTAMAIAAMIVVAGEAAALLAYLATREVHYEDDPPPGRIRFLATAALVLGPIFLTLVLLDGLGAVSVGACRQG